METFDKRRVKLNSRHNLFGFQYDLKNAALDLNPRTFRYEPLPASQQDYKKILDSFNCQDFSAALFPLDIDGLPLQLDDDHPPLASVAGVVTSITPQIDGRATLLELFNGRDSVLQFSVFPPRDSGFKLNQPVAMCRLSIDEFNGKRKLFCGRNCVIWHKPPVPSLTKMPTKPAAGVQVTYLSNKIFTRDSLPPDDLNELTNTTVGKMKAYIVSIDNVAECVHLRCSGCDKKVYFCECQPKPKGIDAFELQMTVCASSNQTEYKVYMYNDTAQQLLETTATDAIDKFRGDLTHLCAAVCGNDIFYDLIWRVVVFKPKRKAVESPSPRKTKRTARDSDEDEDFMDDYDSEPGEQEQQSSQQQSSQPERRIVIVQCDEITDDPLSQDK